MNTVRRLSLPVGSAETTAIRLRKIQTALCDEALRQDLLHDMPMHVRQAAVDPALAIDETFVVDAQQMQHRRVEIVADVFPSSAL